MGAQKRRLFLMIFVGALAALAVLFLIVRLAWPSKEYTAIQYIIENLSDYQGQIESWGYQVEVFDPLERAPESEENFALNHYTEGVYDPVLILTDQTGGRWYFYNGFDQYAQETESMELTPLWGGEKEVVRVVTQFQLFKDRLNRPPLEENNARPDERAYYDVQVHLNVSYYALETEDRVFGPEANHSFTNYSSNNFEDCRHFGGLDPSGLNYDSDREIKERFTAEQLLAFYHQGLALQDKLMGLYYGEDVWEGIRERREQTAQIGENWAPPFSSFRLFTKSDGEVENRLQELYGKPFTVLSSRPVPGEEQAEGVWAARVYLAAPEDDPDHPFFVYYDVTGESFGVPGFATGLFDTYGLSQLQAIFEAAAGQTGLDITFTYGCYPYKEAQTDYYSSMAVSIGTGPENLEQACEVLSAGIQEFLDQTGLTVEDSVNTSFCLLYREADWPADAVCETSFPWYTYPDGPLDHRVESLRDALLADIEAYKDAHPELTAPAEEAPEEERHTVSEIWRLADGTWVFGVDQEETPEEGRHTPPEIRQFADGTWVFRADQVEINPPAGDVALWNGETEAWQIYVWNEEAQQYDQIEP